VCFRPGFLPGAGFSGEHVVHGFFKERSFMLINSLGQDFEIYN
jgi:hypothetical protein